MTFDLFKPHCPQCYTDNSPVHTSYLIEEKQIRHILNCQSCGNYFSETNGEVLRVIKQGENGLVVPPERPEKLAEALLSLKDAALREKLGYNARNFAETELAWPVIGRKLHRFLESLFGD